MGRETRHFDANTGTTKKLRSKESEEDYGYIFDPDLPIIRIDEEWVKRISSTMPELPDIRMSRFIREYKLDEYDARVIIYYDKNLADFFEKCCKLYNNPKVVSNWISNYLIKSLNFRSIRIKDSKVTPETFAELLEMIDKGDITERYAKELIKDYVDTGTSPRKLLQNSKMQLSTEEIKRIVTKALEEDKKAVEELKAGKNEAMQFLIGKILTLTKKQADPKEIKSIILDEIKKK